MKYLNYILDGFGFEDWLDFKQSTFGFISLRVMECGAVLSIIAEFVQHIFGVNIYFIMAYAALVIFEWITGVQASLRRNEKHSSRKLGRMILKIAVYSLPLYIFNTFQNHINPPILFGFEINPFTWLYWTVLIVIIWQLLVSLLENLVELKFRFARILLHIINKTLYQKFNINKEEIDE